MAAAAEAAARGLKVVVVDEQAEPGGQIYRAVERVARERADDLALLGEDYAHGAEVARAFRASAADYEAEATVWQVTAEGEVAFSARGRSRLLKAPSLVIATGAMERPVPIPGWTLPGVLTVGGAQVLLKAAGVVPEGPTVIAGSGPLLFLVAAQLVRAGAALAAVLETAPAANYARAALRLPRALLAPGTIAKGAGLMREVRRAGVRIVRFASNLGAVEGRNGAVEAVEYGPAGRRRRIACETLLLHEGVVPNVHLTRSMGLAHGWDPMQRCWRPALDPWGNTARDRVLVAGDGGGIVGAGAAEAMGRLAALEAARRLGRLSENERDAAAAGHRREFARHLRPRPFLDALYLPAETVRVPRDDATIVCRCEEVSAGEIRAMVAMGCLGPNQTKAFTRCGMGPCQGRLCALTVAEVIAAARGVPVPEVGVYRVRPPIKPLLLGELASLDEG
ncbi:MAG: FAD-dependent oxidoreductase [Proteobacteria bacterium]|nr:FAD-dependent oxidoreductase [Pseudomonadota bacterium]